MEFGTDVASTAEAGTLEQHILLYGPAKNTTAGGALYQFRVNYKHIARARKSN